MPPMRSLLVCVTFLGLLAVPLFAAEVKNDLKYKVGVATVDITPDYPVRLNGFGHRREMSDGVTLKIFAKALAIDDGVNGPAVLVAVDSLGVPDYMTTAVAA